ncbi:hypothetical protein EYF80_063241 [Liparis tanakae]|uniref:Uncharacterized protein n=1 Tax=Liparis tanakae TaxID=230148 RepID=A0A4Z2EEB6_9TELE|nr:hypothetical protein EYF80_063241 [Liparis tanakae]
MPLLDQNQVQNQIQNHNQVQNQVQIQVQIQVQNQVQIPNQKRLQSRICKVLQKVSWGSADCSSQDPPAGTRPGAVYAGQEVSHGPRPQEYWTRVEPGPGLRVSRVSE